MIVTAAVTAVMYLVEAKNSRRFSFGWQLTAFDIFMALPMIFTISTAVWLLRKPRRHKKADSTGSLGRRLGSRMVGPPALSMMAIVVIICLMCWLAALFLGYVADDLSSPAMDERSFPSPRTY